VTVRRFTLILRQWLSKPRLLGSAVDSLRPAERELCAQPTSGVRNLVRVGTTVTLYMYYAHNAPPQEDIFRLRRRRERLRDISS